MPDLAPKPPDFDLAEWSRRPHHERLRMMCAAWALEGFGVRVPIYLFYVVKMALYVLGWAFFVSLSPGHGWIGDIGRWWREPVAFQKLVLWTMLFEVMGLGGASGPLTGRYVPPIGAAVYWLRPGTVRLPPWPRRVPLTAGTTRTPVDVALYAGLLGAGFFALTRGALGRGELLPVVLLLPLIGLRDKTIFLAARAEVHWSYLVVFLFPADAVAGSKIVQVAVWWGAATSKLNRHFPGVVTVMVSNSPFLRSRRIRKAMYRRFPDDLRPSRLAAALAHGGTAVEYAFPLVLLLSEGGLPAAIGLAMMLAFHSFILFSVPMGVPLEWNVFTIYAGLFLFGAHADVSIFSVRDPALLALVAVGLLVGPVLGNLRPDLISFLPSMRYYAGNWGASQWLFRKGMEARLDERIRKVAPTLGRQLASLFDELTAKALIGRGLAFRAMHLHGRAFNELLPRAVDDLEAYDVRDGEAVAGVVLGWNFGDGHLHHHQLLGAVQERCGFAPGDLRVVYLESQPIQRQAHRWAIWDAATGLVEEGEVAIRDLLARQPWEGAPGPKAEGPEPGPAPEAGKPRAGRSG
jgi:hypothetical protein